MKYWICFFLVFATYSFCLSAQPVDFESQLEQKDIDALIKWVKTKRLVTVKEKGGDLSISGEVRTELQSTNERKEGVKQRGSGGVRDDVAIRAWDVELNLLLNYRTERTWATAKLRFDNDAGVISGSTNHIVLDRAFFGGRVIDADAFNIDIEFGRRRLGYTFDSKIEFCAYFDGILFKFEEAWEGIGDTYLYGGPFVVNEKIDQFAYVAELGLLDIYNTGLYTKYSIIDWDTKHTARKVRNERFRFINSQLTLGYKFKSCFFGNRVVTLYAAGLVNSAAKKLKETTLYPSSLKIGNSSKTVNDLYLEEGKNICQVKKLPIWNKKENLAWYAGFSIGELRKQWDWSFDINYQWVQAQAVADFDSSGLGRGNIARVGLFRDSSGNLITINEAVGPGNYKGIASEFNILLTNNITLFQSWQHSVNQNSKIGPGMGYKQYEVELIYAF